MTTLCGLARGVTQFATDADRGRRRRGRRHTRGQFAPVRLLPANRRAMALTVFSLGAPIGAWIGAQVAGTINDLYGWRAVFFALGVPGVLVGVAIYLTVREPKRGCLDAGTQDLAPSVRETLKLPVVAALSRTSDDRQRGVRVVGLGPDVLDAGLRAAYLQPQPRRRRRRDRERTPDRRRGCHHCHGLADGTPGDGGRPSASCGCSAPARSSPPSPPESPYWTRDLAVARVSFWIFIPAIYFYIGPCFGLLNNLAPCRMRAMFCAMTLFLANVGNLIITPIVIGALNDHFALHYSQADCVAAGDAVHRADRPVGDDPLLHRCARRGDGSGARPRLSVLIFRSPQRGRAWRAASPSPARNPTARRRCSHSRARRTSACCSAITQRGRQQD